MRDTIRAIAPTLRVEAMDTFANSHPELRITRIHLPYFETSPDIPPPEDYRQQEGEQIQKALHRMMSERRPDLILIGRETFALHVPDLAQKYSVPSILLIQGTTTAGILKKTIPEAMASKFLEQFQKTDLIIVVAKHLAEKIRNLGLVQAIVIENAIDVERFCPEAKDEILLQQFRIAKQQIVIAHISNLKPLKRPFDFVHAAKNALEQDPSLIFLIIGDGILQESIKTACRQMNLLNQFRFTGWVDYDRVPDLIRLSDIVVMPSEMEARALVFLETQACGRVLIASDIPSAREVIHDGKTGLLFPTGDVDVLTGKILFAASNAELRSQIARNAREVALSRPLSSFLHEYETAIQGVVHRHQLSR
ncbi:glycosyltransferase family 4 protein [bacterium]|nr:glycosyltransferase family 4 protein [bacterium]